LVIGVLRLGQLPRLFIDTASWDVYVFLHYFPMIESLRALNLSLLTITSTATDTNATSPSY
jgi:hypothetical protein